eukprot:3017142-Amphidinium_carterae.1
MAFCICMKAVSDEFWDLLHSHFPDPTCVCQIFGYIDDYVLAIAPGHERLIMNTWTTALAKHGFALNPNKTQIWAPAGVGPLDRDFHALWSQQSSQEGMTLCGAPISLTAEAVHEDMQI